MYKFIAIQASGLLRCLALFMFTASTTICAQELQLQTVVVTANRFEGSNEVANTAAQVITAQEIQEISATTLADILSKLGGVHTRSSSTGIPDSSIDLRGFGMTGDQNTLVLINGQRLSENEGVSARLASIPVNAIERIEIMRGSGAVLFGGGATGGTINILTKTAKSEGVSGDVSFTTGSYKLQDLRASLTQRIGELGFNFNLQDYSTDNYRFGNQAKLQAVNGEIKVGNADFVAINFGADQQRSNLPGVRRINLLSGVDQFVNDPRGITTPKDYVNSDTEHVLLRGELTRGDVIFAMDASVKRKSRTSFGSYEDDSGTSLGDSGMTNYSLSPRVMWSHFLVGNKNVVTFGVDWSEWSYVSNTSSTGTADTLSETARQINKASYIRNEHHISNSTKLSVGARYEQLVQENIYMGQDGWGSPPVSGERSGYFPLTANELAIQQQIDGEYSMYGRIGKSFRIANLDENRCSLSNGCMNFLTPQTSRDKEIGFKWEESLSSFRASYFVLESQNEIHYNAYTGTNMNLPPTKRRGIELNGTHLINPYLDLSVRYALTEAKFIEGTYIGSDYVNGAFIPFSADIAGKNVPLVPRNRLNMTMGLQLDDSKKLSLNVNHVGSQRFDNDQANNSHPMPSYTTADVKVTQKIKQWNWAAGINNLFDKSYYAYGVANVSASPTRFNVYPEPRRNLYLSAQYRFH